MRRSPAKGIWTAIGEEAIRELLAEQGAAIRGEIESRLGDRGPAPRPVHPHIVTNALRGLVARGEAVRSGPVRTRGRRQISVYHAPIVEGVNKGLIEDAAARKRLLQARFLSWAVASKRYPSGLIGPAGNLALHAALTSPDLTGKFALLRNDGRDVGHVLGLPVPGGPLDSAAYVVGIQGGVPTAPVLALFEVKNIRHWIYPSSVELYQLLYKAAAIQQANPAHAIAPVLICRRRHFWARQMAVDLGFFVIELHDQFLLPSVSVTDESLEEVRTGLGYSTLVRLEGAPPRLIQSLGDAFLPHALSTAERWRTHGSTLLKHYAILRDHRLHYNERSNSVADLASDAAGLPELTLEWQAAQDDLFVPDGDDL